MNDPVSDNIRYPAFEKTPELQLPALKGLGKMISNHIRPILIKFSRLLETKWQRLRLAVS
jgi:hypothetical protein